MDAPDLIIPVRFSHQDAVTGLKAIEQAGQKAGDTTVKSMAGVQEATHGAGRAARGFENELAGLVKEQIGLMALKNLAGNIADQFRNTARSVMETAKQFQQLRAAMQQVAALTGNQNQTGFTLQQVEQAPAAGLKPEEWRAAQEEFQSRAGAYLEGDQARLDQEEGKDYQQKIAAFAKARGVGQPEAMALGGGLLQFSEGKQNVGDLMARYGRVFKTLERAPTPVSHLLPQMSRVMSQGFSPEEASRALAIMSQTVPGEEETGVENTLKALTDARLKGKGEGLGLKEGMTPMQQIEAASRRLRDRVAKGENVDELMKEYAPDLRERRGLLGFMNRGVGAGGFERMRGYAAEVPVDFTCQTIAEYQASDVGRQNAVDVELASEQARMGARNEKILRARQIAEVELTRGERFENPLLLDRAKAMLPFSGDVKTQQINRQRRARAQSQLGEQMGYGDVIASQSQAATDSVMLDLLKRIEENTRKAVPMDRPLSAPPPRPAGRM